MQGPGAAAAFPNPVAGPFHGLGDDVWLAMGKKLPYEALDWDRTGTKGQIRPLDDAILQMRRQSLVQNPLHEPLHVVVVPKDPSGACLCVHDLFQTF